MKLTLGRGIRLLIAANVFVVGILLIAVLYDSMKATPPGHPAQSSTAPSASADLMPMGLAHIPTSASCLLCHDSGGKAGLKPIPALGHPIDGWTQCLTCHTDAKLGQQAPGHAGIPQSECLNCHKVAPAGPAITQPHSRLGDQHCLDCHGNVAHLPTSMVGRNEDECWLCHKPTPLPPPQYPHAPGEPLNCRACHQSPEVGGLPIDHALRPDTTCLLCHDILTGAGTPKLSSPKPGASSGPVSTPAGTPGTAP